VLYLVESMLMQMLATGIRYATRVKLLPLSDTPIVSSAEIGYKLSKDRHDHPGLTPLKVCWNVCF
jgi:hypothetical protein